MTKTTIDAERDYVDERLCGVNDMTFKEWLSYQDQMLGTITLINMIVDPYEEEYYPSEGESSEEDDEWDDNNDDHLFVRLLLLQEPRQELQW